MSLTFGRVCEASILPFPVKVGGQEAKAEGADPLVATLAEPVAADAEIEVTVEEDLPVLIISAFPSDANGTPADGATPAIIVGQNTKVVKLDATMDKKTLAPGFYVLNLAAAGKTARVLLQVK